jgi:hypothetical protein
MKEQELKQLYKDLDNKTKFLMDFSKKIGKSHHTIRGWLSTNKMASDLPKDGKLLKRLENELKKAPKKVSA